MNLKKKLFIFILLIIKIIITSLILFEFRFDFENFKPLYYFRWLEFFFFGQMDTERKEKLRTNNASRALLGKTNSSAVHLYNLA